MTTKFKEEEIREYHLRFSAIGKYRDRVALYDHVFGLFPYQFPPFDPELEMLFKLERTSVIDELLEKERRNTFVPEQKFVYGEDNFVFNVSPSNSNAVIFNDFIVSKFINSDTNFNHIITGLRRNDKFDTQAAFKLHNRAMRNIHLIEEQIYGKKETSWRNQFMTVFYHGYFDCRHKTFKKFPRRKKLIELYLYSQGILYGNYIDELVELSSRGTETPHVPDHILELDERLVLFNELGILDLLKRKYKKLGRAAAEKKITEILCLMLGESRSASQRVLDYLKA